MDGPLTSEQLVAIARDAGFDVSLRRLEDWRYRGLFARPARVRSPGKKPLWVYPPGSDRWLLDLCRWRTATKNLEAIQIALWVDGHPIDGYAVRNSLVSVLEDLRRRFERALRDEAARTHGENGATLTLDETLDSLAYRVAGVKGDRPGPKTIRMRRNERARGMGFLARLFMGYELNGHMEDAKQAERALGVSAGRRAPFKWLDGSPEELADLREVIALPSLIESAQTATSNELERARSLARAFVQGLPVVALFAETMFGPRAAGLAAVKNIADPAPEFYCVLLPAFVSALRQGFEDNLRTIEEALDGINELAPAIDDLGALPEDEREKRVSQAAPGERAQVRRFLKLAGEAAKARSSGGRARPTN